MEKFFETISDALKLKAAYHSQSADEHLLRDEADFARKAVENMVVQSIDYRRSAFDGAEMEMTIKFWGEGSNIMRHFLDGNLGYRTDRMRMTTRNDDNWYGPRRLGDPYGGF